MGKPTVEDLANIMTNAITAGFYTWHAIKNGSHREKTVRSQFRRCTSGSSKPLPQSLAIMAIRLINKPEVLR
jgi:hypothetical protein